ncbi:MAG: leucine-rich repeat protein [Bacteroidaceae bacterium]|nr:leucine-rich repeat protein [Bacteroidaceae bacterium]
MQRLITPQSLSRAAVLLLMTIMTCTTAWAQTASTADGWVIEKDVYGTRCILQDFTGNINNVTVYPAIIDGAAVVTIYERVEPKDFPKLETVYMYDHYEFNEMSPVPAGVKHIHVVNSSGTVVAEDAIPDGITKIPDICFYGCAEMEKLTLPKGLKVIGSYAFYGCKDLKDISIPDGVTDIGDYAFSYCDALKDINIPNSVTDIGDYAFDECKALTSITILDGVTDIGKYAFALCEALTSITIPNSVTSIGERAFTFCKALTSITIPSNVTTIANYTFNGCEKLENVIIPNSVTSIGQSAFDGCKALTSITIPTSVTSIGQSAFSGCSNLKDLYFDAPKAQWNAVTKLMGWNSNVHSDYKEHWRCTVTLETNNASYSIPPITNMWSNWTLGNPAATLPIAGWYTDADFTNEWHFNSDLVPGDMTLYAKWDDPCAVTASTDATSIDIPYGQEWTDISVTLNSLTLGWFQNDGRAVREADAVAVTPFVGSGANSDFTFYDGGTTLTATKGAGTHTDGNQQSEPLTAAGQSGTMWIHIPQTTWQSAAAGDYTGLIYYDALFISNTDPVETYTYSLGSDAKVTIRLSIPEAATLTFLPNGGTGDAMPAINTRVGITTTLPSCTYSGSEGKSFLCWNTEADGSGTRHYAGSDFIPTGSTTLYAEWGTDYIIDLTGAAVGESVAIPLGLSAQLAMLTGYFNNEGDPMGLDLNLDGAKDLALVQEYDEVNGVMTASVKKLTSPTQNYHFVLTTSGEEGEYGGVTIKYVNEGTTVEPSAIDQIYDDNGTINHDLILSLKDGQPHNVMLSGRTLYCDGDWNTLCLPFDVTLDGSPLAGATLMEMDAASSGLDGNTLTLNFNTAANIKAGVPYLIKWAAGTNIVNPVFYNVVVTAAVSDIPNPYRYSIDDPEYITVPVTTDVTSTDGKISFKGTYSQVSLDGLDKSTIWFVGAGNTLYNPSDESTSLKALRAYFQIDATAEVKNINMNFEDATGIKLTESTEKTEGTEGGIYNLQGQRLNGVQKGINIVNGKKVFIK